MTGQNDRPDESLTGQAHDQAGHCPLTGRYFEPCYCSNGVELYVSKNLKSIPRPDLQLDVELVKSCWVEVNPCSGKAHVDI